MRPSPFQIPGGERPAPDLREEVQQIYRLLLAGLTALLLLGVGLNVFFFRQFLTVRSQLASTRATVENLAAQYRQKEPAMRNFAAALQTFAAAHPDFQPTLHRYRSALPGFFVQPAGTASNRAPAGTTGNR